MLAALPGGLRTSARAAETEPAPEPALVHGTIVPTRAVVINEVAWGGTKASSYDEWVELYNTTDRLITLTNWTLAAADGAPVILLSGTIPAHGYFLLERVDDDNVSDVPADQIYGTKHSSWAMNNGGEVLELRDGADTLIDSANAENGGSWPAGSGSPGYESMERIDPTAPDTDGNWCSNDGITRNGEDADGEPIDGTPGARNSCYSIPGLSLAKRGPPVATAGLTLTCRLLVSNTGELTATTVVVTDVLPAGLTFVAQDSSLTFSRPASGTLRWEVGDLPGGTLHPVTLTLHADRILSGTVTNVATATERSGRTESGRWTVTVLPHLRLYALEPANYAGGGEAVALVNRSPYTTALAGWCLDNNLSPDTRACLPGGARIGPGQIVWLAQDGDGFYPVWGFDADWAITATVRPVPLLSGKWTTFPDKPTGAATAFLLYSDGAVVDALAYGVGSASQGWTGWTGPAVPYPYVGYGSGQVLYRKLAQSTGLSVPDTDTAADGAQHPDDPVDGRKLRYPGWDLEELFFPAEITTTSNFTLAVAPEGTLDVVSQTIASARHTLRIEAYTLKSVALYEVISARVRAGVAVTILLESNPAAGMDDVEKWIVQRLHNPPTGAVYFVGETAPRYRYQHAKFILVDDRLALVSSDNFNPSSLPPDSKENGTMGHRGFVAVTDSPGVVARLAEIFRRDCDPLRHVDVAPYDDSYAPPGDFTPLPQPDWTTYTARFTVPLATTATHVTVLSAPENALRDRDALLGLLGRAGSGDHVAVMQMDEPFTWTVDAGLAGLNPRLQAAIAAARRGAEVRVLLDAYYDEPLAADKNTAACLRLDEIGGREGLSLTCHLANVTGLGIHAKLFLVSAGDERWIHLGSINGGENSSKRNREVALQFRSPGAYEYILAVFEHDWRRSHGPMTHRVYLPVVMRDYILPADYPLITEVLVNPRGEEGDAGKEWIELYNPGPEIGIAGWTLGDAVNAGEFGDGRYAFPAGAELLHGQVIVAAACATDFSALYGFNPDYEWTDCDGTVPDLTPAGSWDGFGMALGNQSDEVLLLNGSGTQVDSVAWGGAPRVGVTPFADFTAPFPSAASLKRYPPDTDRDDCSRDFYVSYNPSPGKVAGN